MALEVYSPGSVNGQGPTQDFNLDGQVNDLDAEAAAQGALGSISSAWNDMSNSTAMGYAGTLAGMLGLGSLAGPIGSAIGNAFDISNANDSISAANDQAGLGLGVSDYFSGLVNSLSLGMLGTSVTNARDRNLNTIAIDGIMGLPGIDASNVDSNSLSYDLPGNVADLSQDVDMEGDDFSFDTSGDQGGDIGGGSQGGVDGSAGFGAAGDAGGWFAHGGLVRHWLDR